jgi:DNA repair protein RecO (recombination protein O)
MTEPLPAAAIQWVCGLTAVALPERYAAPGLYAALNALLEAIAVAPSARGWVGGLVAYETMLLSELGYGPARPDPATDFEGLLAALARLEPLLANSLLAGRKSDVMAARKLLTERLKRIT